MFHALLADCPVLYLSITALLGAYLLRAQKPTAAEKIGFVLLVGSLRCFFVQNVV
ncbi:MAG: hypothetical protein ACLUNO_02660 [Oscillospiraceae bacterium]